MLWFARLILVWFALLVGIATPRVSTAQTLPQPALLPPANPLCDSPLVPCLDIDDLAAHAYAHFLILPATIANPRDSSPTTSTVSQPSLLR